MTTRVPLLQLVHISDLHVGDGYDDKARIAQQERGLRRKLRDILEFHNVAGWREGTLTSDTTAIRALEAFLKSLRVQDGEWFSAPGTPGPETWLLDTGDLTTFGDSKSIDLALVRLERWRKLLDPCQARVLFGNHDAWPGTQPAILAGGQWQQLMDSQRKLLDSYPLLRTPGWLHPFSVENKALKIRIELYGLSSVLFGAWPNMRAIGEIESADIDALERTIASRESPDVRTYRVLATHHPLTYPYEPADTRVAGISVNVLVNGLQTAQRLANQGGQYGSPRIHMFLSGHTHGTHPGSKLTHTVEEVHQAGMAKRQLQLVVGPVMLVRSLTQIQGGSGPGMARKRESFSDASIFAATRQFQVLRFFSDEDYPDGLVMQRYVMAYLPGTEGYCSVPELRSETVVLF